MLRRKQTPQAVYANSPARGVGLPLIWFKPAQPAALLCFTCHPHASQGAFAQPCMFWPHAARQYAARTGRFHCACIRCHCTDCNSNSDGNHPSFLYTFRRHLADAGRMFPVASYGRPQRGCTRWQNILRRRFYCPGVHLYKMTYIFLAHYKKATFAFPHSALACGLPYAVIKWP